MCYLLSSMSYFSPGWAASTDAKRRQRDVDLAAVHFRIAGNTGWQNEHFNRAATASFLRCISDYIELPGTGGEGESSVQLFNSPDKATMMITTSAKQTRKLAQQARSFAVFL